MFATAAALVSIGIAAIYATEHPAGLLPPSSQGYENWQRQVTFALLGLAAALALNILHYRRLGQLSYFFYAVSLALLAVLLLDKFADIAIVPVRRGSRRWIELPYLAFVRIQPSEFCKLAYILALAWYLRYKTHYAKFTALIGPFALTLLPMALILAEPNLGTVILMMPVFFAMIFAAGARVKHLLIIILMAVATTPFFWHTMQDYQKMRISSLLLQSPWLREKARENPTLRNILVGGGNIANWEQNHGYQLTHSKFAVASGNLAGSGYRKGLYIRYPFLPDRHNDFIFATIAHQWGFIGCIVLLGLYVVLITCGLEIAWSNTDRFARLASVGLVTMFAVEILVNISMNLGLMPITGLTLPLVSYGGSSLVANMAAVGLLNNIGSSRPFSVAAEPTDYK